MSIITNDDKGSQISGLEMSNNFAYIRDALTAAGMLPKIYEPLEGDIWHLDDNSNYRKLQLTGDLNLFTEGGKSPGVYELCVKQPANGGKLLRIDKQLIPIHPTEVTTIVVKVNPFGKEYHSSISIEELLPRIFSQSKGVTTIQGGLVQFFVRGSGIDKALVYQDGVIIEEKKAPSFQFRMKTEANEGSYQFWLQNAYGGIWSDEMFAVMAEAEPVYIASDPVDVEVEAGETAKLTWELGGSPSPRANVEKLVGTEWEVVAKNVSSPYSFIAYDTEAQYRITATNRYKVNEAGEYDPAGEYKIFPAESAIAIVRAKKQDQPAPNPIVAYDDLNDLVTLGDLLPGKTLVDLRVKIDTDEPITPTTMTVFVGDRDIPLGKVETYYIQTNIYNQSPSVFSTSPFNTTVVPTDFKLTANKVNLVQNGKNITSTIQTGGTWAGSDYIGNKSLKAGDEGWLQIKKGTIFGVLGWQIAPKNDSPDHDLVSIGEYGTSATNYTIKFGANGSIGVPLTDAVPYLRIYKAKNGTVTAQRLYADGTVFDAPDTSGVPPITQEVFVHASVAAIDNTNILVEPRYMGITNK